MHCLRGLCAHRPWRGTLMPARCSRRCTASAPKRRPCSCAATRLLPRAEPFAGELLAKSLREAGIDVRFGRTCVRVEREGYNFSVTAVTRHDASPAG
jgi:hypothetical protein